MSPADMARAALAIGQGGLLGHLAEGEGFPEDLMDKVGNAFLHSLVVEAQGKQRSRRSTRSARPRKEEVT